MDELSQLAQESYKDLMELGLQVESRFSAEIFNVAGTMLALDYLLTAKLNKKLKMIELQLKKAALDHKMSEKSEELDIILGGSGQVLDRNELLNALLSKTKNK